jgi:hypothetical protein
MLADSTRSIQGRFAMARQGRDSKNGRMRAGVLAAVGAALAAGQLPATAAVGPSLGVARSFAALAGSTLTNTGSNTMVTGDVGVSPGSEITGFGPGQVSGGIYVGGDAKADQAHSDATLAYTFLAGMASIEANNLTGTDLGGLTLAPGVYKFNSSAQLTGALVLDAGGDSTALFVFQIGSTLTSAPGSSVTVINGGADYDESNIFWQVSSSATLDTGTAFVGNILAYASITLDTGSSLTGNALALIGAVTMDSNVATSPTLAAEPPPVPGAPDVPSGLTASPILAGSCTGSDLEWKDESDNETEFRVYRRDGAAPGFVLVGTVVSADVGGTGDLLTYRDEILDNSTTYNYRVTAFSAVDGESVPSNDVRVEACVVSGDQLVVTLGRRKSTIKDLKGPGKDGLFVKGSYTVIGGDTLDPRTDGVVIQVRAPGTLVLLAVPAGDAGWKKSNRKNVYRWKSPKGEEGPVSKFTIDTTKKEFTLKSRKNEFGSEPVNAITVSLGYQGKNGSDTRAWAFPKKLPSSATALFMVPRAK